MITFVAGLLLGALLIVMVVGARRQRMFRGLAAEIAATQQRLERPGVSSAERLEQQERLAVLLAAEAGTLPIDRRQRVKLAAAILPSLALLVALVYLWVASDLEPGFLLGLGLGGTGTQVGIRVQALVWRPRALGRAGS